MSGTPEAATPGMDPGPGHCDAVADDPAAPEALRRYLAYARLPAVCKLPGISGARLAECLKWIPEEERPFVWTDAEPRLFADLVGETVVRIPPPDWIEGAEEKVIVLGKGARVRVVMASRFGDVGVSTDLKAARGWLTRLPLSGLTAFSDVP